MADDRTDLPGSGNVEPEGQAEGGPPPSPQAAAYERGGPPEPEGSTRSWWPLCLIVGLLGCGCLIVLLIVFGVVGGIGWGIFNYTEPTPEGMETAPQPMPQEPPPARTPTPPPPVDTPQPLPEDGGTEEGAEIYQPGEEVAKEAALGHVEQPDWVARVDSHSEDWRRATVSVGPPASEWVYVVTLQWNEQDGSYDQVSIENVDYPGME